MATLKLSLPAKFKAYIDLQIADGRYKTADEFLQALIREDAERELEAALLKGLESGPGTPMTDADWNKLHLRLDEQTKRRAQPCRKMKPPHHLA